jgi:hypothetical protein
LARPKKRPHQAELLTEAADFLDEEGRPRHAAAVREALSELTRVKARDDNPTLTLYTYRDTWRAAQAAGSVPDIIDEGFAAFLAGRFKPKKTARGAGGVKGVKGSFSARATVERRDEVLGYAIAHTGELGWSPSPQQVAAAWLEHKYGPHKRT